ncbi:hypothetical protein [Aureispira sp. CCB-E]|uniref:hypothetical protein n=1 Tax=Aureispira sp. CCB-E TaxID=3051121 RepID=UPI002868B59B|nr:hypothetical protein [Aureispira sp. CCB-E]WMX12770.1 hypothetical protein QP953_18205 [Aureispira sp. CCB-E]
MANENKNLWPDFDMNPVVTPKAILLEQGNFLNEKTKNVLHVDVSTVTQTNGDTVLHFYIVAPNMNNYRYLLLSIMHKITLYPLELDFHTPEITYECVDQEDLLSDLKEIFNHESTIKIIHSLLAQSK